MTTSVRESEYLSIAAVAMVLGCSAPTVRRAIAAGELRAVRLGQGPRRSIRVPRRALDEWLHGVGGREGAA